MCIAILKPANTRGITDAEFESCWKNNNDGAGFAYVTYSKEKRKHIVVVETSLFYKDFIKKYRIAEKTYDDSPFLIHFRASTAGTISLENCHPFSISDTQAFIHNGTIYTVAKTEKKSDTHIFNTTILQQLPKKWEQNDAIVAILEDYIGSTGKVVVLNANKTHLILHESKGHWLDDMWFSNDDYKTFRRGNFSEYGEWIHRGGGKWVQTYGKKYEPLALGPPDVIPQPALKRACEFCSLVFDPKELQIVNWDDKYVVCKDCAGILAGAQ